jgi:hypothetical protein
MKKLAVLDLSGTKVTDSAVEAISRSNPNCRLVWK